MNVRLTPFLYLQYIQHRYSTTGIVLAVLVVAVGDNLVLNPNLIPHLDPRNGKYTRLPLRYFTELPASLRFDEKVREDLKRVEGLLILIYSLALIYPLLAGVFFHSGTTMQVILILLFFSLRAGFEYIVDAITSKDYGSDGMPIVSFVGYVVSL